MFRSWQIRMMAAGLSILLVGSLIGCAAQPSTPKQSVDVEVKRLGIAYMKFLGRHQGKSPADRAELEQFIKVMPEGERSAIGIHDIAEIFHSSRDGEPLVVRYGIAVPPPGPNPTVIAYEQTGMNNKRMVVYGNGGIEEITSEKLTELVPDAK